MNTFNKKSLCVALAATGMLGAAGVAQAVNVSADGLGNVLIYPYYTVRNDSNGNAYNTLMSVVNTTGSTKAVKVRFREGKNSVEVLDFNVFLSPFDVWTASITPTAAGGGQVTTNDKSCTIPSFYVAGVAQQVPFRTLLIDPTDNPVTRTSEGYVEVFEMATYTAASVIGVNSKHTAAGVPLNCALVTNLTALAEQQAPAGGIFGSEIILSPAGGGAFSQAATALANFSTVAAYVDTTSASPTLGDAVPRVSNVIVGPNLYSTDWAVSNSFNPVTAVLMADAVTNEFVLDAGSKSQTSWIITFPTKFNYVQGAPIAPFTKTFVTKVGACENFYGVVFNREEATPQSISNDDFSPPPVAGAGPTLCWEAQSVGFGTSNVFGSANHNNIATSFSNGWATLGFNSVGNPTEHQLVAPAGNTARLNLLTAVNTPALTATYFGLPLIGFAAETFQNDAITIGGKTFLSTFGATFPHHATKRTSP